MIIDFHISFRAIVPCEYSKRLQFYSVFSRMANVFPYYLKTGETIDLFQKIVNRTKKL